MKNAIIITLIGVFALSLPLNAQKHPDFTITHQCKTSTVKSQDNTGTCWAYTTVSFLESEILRKGGKEYDLSEMYIVRNTYPYKAELYIRYHGNNNFGQGGQAHDAVKAWREFGLVPESVYPGIMYGGSFHTHSVMEAALKTVVDRFADAEKKLPPQWINHYEAILNGFLGPNPTSFDFEGNTYTPESFAKSLDINPDDYIEFTSYSHRPYYKPFVLELPDNWAHELYYNLPFEDFLALMKHALQNGYSIAWDGDVSGDGFDHRKGKAVLLSDEKELLNKKGAQDFRQILFNNFTATDDHLMHLTGLAKDKQGKLWFQTKNSWGDSSNEYDGYLYMSEEYITGMTIAFMVHKDAVPAEIKKNLGL